MRVVLQGSNLNEVDFAPVLEEWREVKQWAIYLSRVYATLTAVKVILLVIKER